MPQQDGGKDGDAYRDNSADGRSQLEGLGEGPARRGEQLGAGLRGQPPGNRALIFVL